jgi:hypothetical protein
MRLRTRSIVAKCHLGIVNMTKETTQVYLESSQKKALQAKARAHGTRLAEEVRRAVDAYLADVSPAERRMADVGSRNAAQHLAEMSDELERLNARLDEAFATLLRSKRRGSIQ